MTKKLFLLPMLAVLLVGCNGGNNANNGGGGNGGTKTEKTITFDFSTAPAGTPTSWSGSATNTFATTVNNYAFSVTNGFFQAPTEYVADGALSLTAKKASAVAMITNVAAIPSAIKKSSFLMPTEISSGSVSALAPFVVEYGTSAITAVSTKTADDGKKGGTGVTLEFDCAVENASYFAINVVQGVSTTGKAGWYNGLIKTLTVTYLG